MPLKIIRNDITKMKVDAIVNAANNSLMGGGGVDGAIHKAAGPKLLLECMKLKGCETGQAKITKGYDLPCQYVIHTVGPRYKDGMHHERELLTSCYQSALALAKANNCQSVAFPLISAGVYGYPKEEAICIARNTIGEFLTYNDMEVYLVIFDKQAHYISEQLFDNIQEYINDNYAIKVEATFKRSRFIESIIDNNKGGYDSINLYHSLDQALQQIDESFSQMLLRKIDEANMSDVECYKKANISRKLFSKIRSDHLYRPSKPTVIAFAIALELSLEETKEMLMKAGFALSHSNKFDIIIEYFIKQQIYDIYEINEALFSFDQNLLGA